MFKSKNLSSYKHILYFILPIILLFIIFKSIDFKTFQSYLKETDLFYLLLGVGIMPFSIVLGSKRYHLLSNYYNKIDLPYKFLAYHYWAGLAVGYFTPGNLGWDAYRVSAVAKKINEFTSPVITIIAEKIIGFIAILSMIAIVYPFIGNKLVKNVNFINNIYYILFIVMWLMFLSFKLIPLKKRKIYLNKLNIIIRRIFKKFYKFLKPYKLFMGYSDNSINPNLLISILKSPGLTFICLIMSWGVLFISAICNQFFFQAVGYEIDFLINLLAAPVFFILFFIPFSFGSLGVREGVYILFYGHFGVPLEIALLVSILSLIGLVLNNSLGAIIIFIQGIKLQTRR